MGGPTGRTKNGILRAMYEAEAQGDRVYVKQLAQMLNVKINTISGHMFELAQRQYVREQMRGQWALTINGRNYAQSLLPQPQSLETRDDANVFRARQRQSPGIEYRGKIAAGAAISLSQEHLDEYLPPGDLDPERHFAVRVQGKSMIGFGILDGGLAILRSVTNWSEVPAGAIVAALVPEGTDVESDDWLERGKQVERIAEDDHQPLLDHVTLKKVDARMLSYIRQGVAEQRLRVILQGSQGTLRPIAVGVAGVLVRIQRDYSW